MTQRKTNQVSKLEPLKASADVWVSLENQVQTTVYMCSSTSETLEQAFHDQAIQQNATASFDSSNVTSSIAHLTGAITSLASEIQRLASPRRDPPRASEFDGSGDYPDEIRSHKRRRVQGQEPRSHIQVPLHEKETVQSLPSGLIEEVVQLYFDRVFYWIPVIHHPRFREEIKQVSGRQRLRVIIDAMLVATLRFVDGGRYGLSDDDVERLVEARRNSVLISAMSSLSIENLQALVILAFTTVSNMSMSDSQRSQPQYSSLRTS